LLIRLLSQTPYLAGIGLDLLGFLASIAALRTLPLFFVEATIASSIGVTVLLAVVVLDVRLQRREILALAGLGIGLLLLAVSAKAETAHPLARAGQWALLAGVAAVFLLGIVSARSTSRKAAPSLAIGAGLGFAGLGIAARALVVPHPVWRLLEEPLVWAVVGYGVAGMLLFATALQRGSVTTATALTFAMETVIPSVVGLGFLGDSPRSGYAVVAAAGFVLTLAGAIALARYGGTVGVASPSGDGAAARPTADGVQRSPR
jgi:drug/metabolite transporter (DMT)-like permease